MEEIRGGDRSRVKTRAERLQLRKSPRQPWTSKTARRRKGASEVFQRKPLFLFPHFISTIFSLPLNNFQPYNKCNVLNECKRYSGILDQKSPNRPEAYAPPCSPHTHTHTQIHRVILTRDYVKTPSCCAEGKVTHEAKLCWQFLIPAHQGFKLYNKEMTCWITSRVCLKI